MILQPQQYPFITAITAHTEMHRYPLFGTPLPPVWDWPFNTNVLSGRQL
jgi:hypothetical protein